MTAPIVIALESVNRTAFDWVQVDLGLVQLGAKCDCGHPDCQSYKITEKRTQRVYLKIDRKTLEVVDQSFECPDEVLLRN